MATEAAFDGNKVNKAMDQYSRQIGTIGVETMQRLASLDVLVVGMRGVGVEVAKNIALLGARSVTIADDEPVQIADLGTNYWFKESDIGKARAHVCLEELSKLNPFTDVTRHEGAISSGDLVRFGVVIVTAVLPRATLEEWGNVCHNHTLSVEKDGMVVVVPSPILFIVALTLGVTSFLFSDMGNTDTTADGERVHTITDDNGEPPIVNVVESLMHGSDDKGPRILVRIPGNKAHGLDDGDLVYFSEVQIAELCNDNAADDKQRLAFPVERVYTEYADEKGNLNQKLVPDHFVVRPPSCAPFDEYKAGGFATQVKKPKRISFRPLARSLVSPVTESSIFGMMLVHPNTELVYTANRGEQLHFALLALWEFQAEHGRLPALHNVAEAEACADIAQRILARHKESGDSLVVEEIDRVVVIKTALYAAVELPSNCAFLGGIAAQEIVKKSGKYTPLHQWLYLDEFAMTRDTVPEDAAPIGSRYDHQIAIFGRAYQEKLGKQRWFMVGTGALGCEYLKGFALMGLGANGGELHVTDNDRIEVSNLNRQFLFRAENVGHPKSVCAAAAAKRMNPAMNITSHEVKVCPETENTFNTAFWHSLDGVCNALDNVHARRYTDTRCVLFKKPLLESGTLGTKANSEIIIPYHTQSYNDIVEQENDDAIPMCTLKLFPHLIEHCIEWARAEFHDVFEALPKDIEKFVTDRNAFFNSVKKSGTVTVRLDKLRQIKTFLGVVSKPVTFADCLQLAADLYLHRFRDRILDLTYSCPENFVKHNPATGKDELFWTGTRRFPRAAELPSPQSSGEDWALSYLHAVTNLYAFMFGVPQIHNLDDFRQLYGSTPLQTKEWQPPSKPVNVDDKADADADDTSEEDISNLAALEAELRAFDSASVAARPVAADFEKDDDTNFHIDFITAASNMRAGNYHIKQATRFKCKMIAGRITPALATTTAMITGVMLNELYKFLLGVPPNTQFQSNINLATSTFNYFEVLPPKKTVSGFDEEEQDDVVAVPEGWNTWNTLAVNAVGLTVKQFVDSIPAANHGVVAQKLYWEGKDDKGKAKALYIYKRTPLPIDDKAWFAAAQDRLLLDVVTEVAGPLAGEYVRLHGSFETPDGDTAVIPPLYARIA